MTLNCANSDRILSHIPVVETSQVTGRESVSLINCISIATTSSTDIMSGRGFEGNGYPVSASLTIGLGLLAATMTVLTAGSVGILGYVLGRQFAENNGNGNNWKGESSNKSNKSKGYTPRRLRVPSGTASEDVRISDKKAIVDVRITGIRPLIPPACLLEEIPLTTKAINTVSTTYEWNCKYAFILI